MSCKREIEIIPALPECVQNRLKTEKRVEVWENFRRLTVAETPTTAAKHATFTFIRKEVLPEGSRIHPQSK